jgi:signal transduction histidine kinase
MDQNLVIESDPRQLRQLFWNLFINAGQAMPDGGTLHVSATNARGTEDGFSQRWVNFIKIVVSDTGCGIDHEYLPKIFDPFFTTKEKGTGLGLSVVHRIVEGLNGRIIVESTKNKGTSFTIWIPISEQ